MKMKPAAMIGAVVVAAALLGVPLGSAQAEPGGDPPNPPVLTSSLRLNDAVEALRKYEEEPGFGAFVLDNESGTLRVLWNGGVPSDFDAAQAKAERVHGVSVDVQEAKFSRDALETQVNAIADAMTTLGLPILSVGPNPDLSQLEVELNTSQVAEGSGAGNLLESQLAALVEAPVVFSYLPGQNQDRTRQNDSDPWQGAGGMFNRSDDAFCTVGWSVLTPGGYGRLLGAAHCAPEGNAVLQDGARDRLSDGGADVDVRPSWDSLLIDPVGGTIGKVFGGPWNAGTGHNRYQFHVGGDANASVGEDVCVSGANTGEHCNAEVIRANFQFSCNGGQYMCPGFRVGSTNGNLIGGGGDSGGAVYIERSDGRVGARGVYVNGVSGYFLDCNVGRFPQGNNGCDRRINVVGIDELEDVWGVRVEYD